MNGQSASWPQRAALAALLVLACLAAPARAAGQELRLGQVDNFPPLAFTIQGQPVGFAKDLADLVAREMGREASYTAVPAAATLFADIREGRTEAIIVAAPSPERREFLDFTRPYLTLRERIYLRAGENWAGGLESLFGKRVAVVQNHISWEYLRGFPQITLLAAESPYAALALLLGNQADALVYPDLVIEYLAQRMRLNHRIGAAGEPLRTLEYCMAVRKGEAAALEQMNAALNRLDNSGELEELHKRWFSGGNLLEDYTDRELAAMAAALAGLALLAGGLLFTVLRALRLRRGVRRAEADRDALAAEVRDLEARAAKARADLHERSAQLDAAIESMQDAVFISDEQGRFILFNEAFATYHRFRNKQECGKTLADYPGILDVYLDTGEPAPLEQWAVPRALRGESATNAVYGLRRKDTGVTWTGSYNFAPIRDQAGRITGSVVVGRDITEARRAEQALRDTAQRLNLALASSNAGIWEWRLDTNENVWSPEVFRLYDLDPGNAAPSYESWRSAVHPDQREEAERSVGEAAANHRPISLEYRVNTRDGSERWGLSLGQPQFDAAGRATRYLGIVMDITARKLAELQIHRQAEDLQRSNADLEQFAYVASHDLQEPLRKVSSFLNLLAERYGEKLDDEAREFIGFAVDGAVRMKSMIEDLLAYSRVHSKGRALQPTDMQEALRAVLADLQMAAAESGAEVLGEGLPVVRADGAQMQQLLRNLLGNAIKYRSAAPPRITVSAEQRDGGWEFAVADNGIGIAPEHRERIFQIFQRLHGRGKYPGTGIGLAICRKIVERHGGRIWADAGPEGGAVFRFTIPDAKEWQP